LENESEAVYQKREHNSLIAHFAFIAGNYTFTLALSLGAVLGPALYFPIASRQQQS
jgi:hypothetical protein